jgi:hypothetical protein
LLARREQATPMTRLTTKYGAMTIQPTAVNIIRLSSPSDGTAFKPPPCYPTIGIPAIVRIGRVLTLKGVWTNMRMVQVWVDLHEDELLANWELAVAGDGPFRIAPLQ